LVLKVGSSRGGGTHFKDFKITKNGKWSLDQISVEQKSSFSFYTGKKVFATLVT